MFQSHIHTQGLCVSQWGSDPKAFVFSSEGLTPSLQGAQIIRCWKSVPVEGPQQGECTSRRWKEREGAQSAQQREQAGESRERERIEAGQRQNTLTSPSKLERLTHLEPVTQKWKKRGLSSSSILQPMQFHQPKLCGPSKTKQNKTHRGRC